MTEILITGAGGFVGKHLVSLLSARGYSLRLGLRNPADAVAAAMGIIRVGFDLCSPDNNYRQLLHRVDVVIHLAGIAHRASVSHEEYVNTNTDGTVKLLEEAASRGVRRFIFLSTVKVHGENNTIVNGQPQPITEIGSIFPRDDYSKSKLVAEQAIIDICETTGIDYVILRPPLVYGPGVKANFLKLLKLVANGYPLPLAGIRNKRSLVHVENLCDLIRIAVDNPAMANKVYLLKDYDFSTPELITEIAHAFAIKPRLWPCPVGLLNLAGRIFRQRAAIDRLTGSLFINNSKLLGDVDWTPPVDIQTGMQRTAAWYNSLS